MENHLGTLSNELNSAVGLLQWHSDLSEHRKVSVAHGDQKWLHACSICLPSAGFFFEEGSKLSVPLK